MPIYKIQGTAEKKRGVYYEFDSDRILGEGGMGKVYKGSCVNAVTHKKYDVAVKFMYSDLTTYAIEKARREAAIHFRHDNLVEMLGFIETETQSPLGETERHYHVVSELLEGTSLAKLLEGRLTDQWGNFVPYAEKLYKDYTGNAEHFGVEIAKSILSGLMAMHDAGYMHRDIDPTNIMITSDGRIKLIDFGIAKRMNSLTQGDRHLTQAGQFVGKPDYAAPELVLGAIDEQNQTTDLYAVGVLLYQCITGKVPFEGDRTTVLNKQLHSDPPLSNIKDKRMRDIIGKAMKKDRAARYQSAAEFRVALEQYENSDQKPTNHVWAWIGGIAVACFMAVGVTVLINWHSDQTGIQDPDDGINTYQEALAALHDDERARKGVEYLAFLSEKGNADASYLLSQLYFDSRLEEEDSPDSIITFRSMASLSVDNTKAHELLEKSVSQNGANYHALYDLACNYWKADQRTEAVKNRDGVKAEKYFRIALKYAERAGDLEYQRRINEYLGKIELWKANVSSLGGKVSR